MAVWQPRTSFAFTPDGARVAYQVVGSGDRDVVFLTDWSNSIDLMWELPQIERFLRRLASIGRLILFDKRGNGASDGLVLGTDNFKGVVEQSADDLLAVLDAVESKRADLVASTAGGTTALLFAATHPERCGRLVLQDACPRVVSSPEYPFGLDEAGLQFFIDGIRTGWGKGSILSLQPDLFEDRDLRMWFGRYERMAVERSWMVEAWEQIALFDIRAVPVFRAGARTVAGARRGAGVRQRPREIPGVAPPVRRAGRARWPRLPLLGRRTNRRGQRWSTWPPPSPAVWTVAGARHDRHDRHGLVDRHPGGDG